VGHKDRECDLAVVEDHPPQLATQPRFA
jgi:hypothetical protein